MMQQPEPDDYVLATNQTHSVQEFCEVAFSHVGLHWKDHVKYDARYERPAEVDLLVADPGKARAELGWQPTVDFAGLIAMMVDADLERLGSKS